VLLLTPTVLVLMLLQRFDRLLEPNLLIMVLLLLPHKKLVKLLLHGLISKLRPVMVMLMVI